MSTGKPVPIEGKTVHVGDSAVQRVAEPLMVEAVAKVIGVPLAKKRLPLANGISARSTACRPTASARHRAT